MRDEAVQPSEGDWANTLKDAVASDWRDLIEGEWASKVKDGSWSTDAMRGWFLQLFPFIHSFPKFLAEALIKVEDDYSRSFLIDNIRVEKAHAEHWIWMGEGFGITRAQMMALVEGDQPVLRDVQSLTDWIWYINTKGSLAEAVAATSFAIEGATGDLTRALLAGFEAYGLRDGVVMNAKTTKWFRNHSRYDDEHPRIALNIVARYAQSPRVRQKVIHAARRSLQLLNLALLASSRAYATQAAFDGLLLQERASDRRRAQVHIDFPDRRSAGERAGAAQRAA